MMRLLFIKLKHIGDLLLLTPTLAGIKAAYPDAVIWVVCRRGTESILEGCPHVDRVLTGPEPEVEKRGRGQLGRTVSLIRELRAQRFDHVIELGDHDRGRFLALASGAHERTTIGWNPHLSAAWRLAFDHLPNFNWWTAHRVLKDWHTTAAAIPALAARQPGPLVFAPERRMPATLFAGEPYAVLHPATRWPEKEWVAEHWISVGRDLTQRGLRLAVSSGPAADEIETARRIADGIGSAAVCTGGQLSWAELAGLLSGARLFAGVDTAAMHLAAACGIPVLGIFGPSLEWQWHPWQCPHRVCALPVPDEPDIPRRIQLAEQRRTKDVPLADVQRACGELLG